MENRSVSKRRVLVVDDEPAICEVLHDVLEPLFDVDIASDGQEAFEKFEQNEYCSVVTDITMPKMTGIELLQAIRSVNNNIPVIIITGYATIENTIIALKHGAYNFIQKPINIHELKKTLKKAANFYIDIIENENIDKKVLPSVKNASVSYEFESDCDHTKEMCHQICKYMEMQTYTKSDIDDMFFVLYELVPNAVIHGNLDVHGEKDADFYEAIAERVLDERYRSKKVFIDCTITSDKIQVVIEDQGNGFDVSSLPEPTDEENFFKLSGRGIFLSRFHVDSLEYNEKGNVVTIIKSRSVH